MGIIQAPILWAASHVRPLVAPILCLQSREDPWHLVNPYPLEAELSLAQPKRCLLWTLPPQVQAGAQNTPGFCARSVFALI